MNTAASLQTELTAVTEKLIQLLQQFTTDTFTKKGNAESWSAAEVAEHLVITNKNIGYVLQAEGEVADRAPDKKLPVIKEALEDRETKRVAPENVKPTGTVADQELLINGLQKQTNIVLRVLEEKDLNPLCTIYKHPSLGRLTRLEWICFIIYHNYRHAKQLEQIHSEVTN